MLSLKSSRLEEGSEPGYGKYSYRRWSFGLILSHFWWLCRLVGLLKTEVGVLAERSSSFVPLKSACTRSQPTGGETLESRKEQPAYTCNLSNGGRDRELASYRPTGLYSTRAAWGTWKDCILCILCVLRSCGGFTKILERKEQRKKRGAIGGCGAWSFYTKLM